MLSAKAPTVRFAQDVNRSARPVFPRSDPQPGFSHAPLPARPERALQKESSEPNHPPPRFHPNLPETHMPPPPTVSVIIPTYNRAPYIADSLHSVLAQTRPAAEIIVVDDGSTDGTDGVVARFAPRVAYIRQANAGKLVAIATGLDHVTGDLVWVMDDDDIAPPDALALLAAPFADPDVVMSYGRMTRFSDEGGTRTETEVIYPRDDRPFFVRLMEGCFITGHPCVLVRRAALERMRPFAPDILASVDYYIHLGVARQGATVPVDGIVLRQRQHPGLRGPARLRYAESDRVARWIAHDKRLIGDLLDTLPDAAYLAPPPWDGPAPNGPDLRRARLQRAVIAGRKTLWPRATADLAAAMAMLPARPLDASERHILTGLLGSRYGIEEVHANPSIPAGLRRALAPLRDRNAALAAITRPLLHHIKIARRERDPARARRAIRTWLRLMDPAATLTALGASLHRNLTRVAARMRRVPRHGD
jgi:hypothetical protein